MHKSGEFYIFSSLHLCCVCSYVVMSDCMITEQWSPSLSLLPHSQQYQWVQGDSIKDVWIITFTSCTKEKRTRVRNSSTFSVKSLTCKFNTANVWKKNLLYSVKRNLQLLRCHFLYLLCWIYSRQRQDNWQLTLRSVIYIWDLFSWSQSSCDKTDNLWILINFLMRWLANFNWNPLHFISSL